MPHFSAAQTFKVHCCSYNQCSFISVPDFIPGNIDYYYILILTCFQGRAPYTIQSVNAVINKLGEIITEVCNSSSSLCPEFRSVTDVGSRLSAKLANLSPKSNGFGTINGEANTNFGFYVYNQGWALVSGMNILKHL